MCCSLPCHLHLVWKKEPGTAITHLNWCGWHGMSVDVPCCCLQCMPLKWHAAGDMALSLSWDVHSWMMVTGGPCVSARWVETNMDWGTDHGIVKYTTTTNNNCQSSFIIWLPHPQQCGNQMMMNDVCCCSFFDTTVSTWVPHSLRPTSLTTTTVHQPNITPCPTTTMNNGHSNTGTQWWTTFVVHHRYVFPPLIFLTGSSGAMLPTAMKRWTMINICWSATLPAVMWQPNDELSSFALVFYYSMVSTPHPTYDTCHCHCLHWYRWANMIPLLFSYKKQGPCCCLQQHHSYLVIVIVTVSLSMCVEYLFNAYWY